MTTNKIYFCNFCRLQYRVEEVHGLLWVASDRLEKRDASNSENHLCDNCLTAITTAGKEYEAMRPVTP